MAEQQEYIIDIQETKRVSVKAHSFLAALAEVWEAEKNPDNIIPIGRDGLLTRCSAALSPADYRFMSQEEPQP